MSFVFILIAFIAAACVAAFVIVQRGGEVRALAERGQAVRGRVTGRQARHSKGSAGRYRRVKLAYDGPDGTTHERWIAVTQSEWDSLEEGVPVDLVYLPERPSVFAMRTLVNQARAAKNMAPL